MTAVILVAPASSGTAVVAASARQGIVALAFSRAAPLRLRPSVAPFAGVGAALGVFPCTHESPWTVQRSRRLPGSSVMGTSNHSLN